MRRARGGHRRLAPATWILLGAMLAVSLSLAIRALRRARALPPAGVVQVLNGSGIPDLGRIAAETLRARGIDVVMVGNADASNYQETVVLQRRGPDSVARMVAQRLGAGVPVQQLDPTLLVDATVIVGRDLLTHLPPGARARPEGAAEPSASR
jgi:LytR cell envelope-related transcriptional attenuator